MATGNMICFGSSPGLFQTSIPLADVSTVSKHVSFSSSLCNTNHVIITIQPLPVSCSKFSNVSIVHCHSSLSGRVDNFKAFISNGAFTWCKPSSSAPPFALSIAFPPSVSDKGHIAEMTQSPGQDGTGAIHCLLQCSKL